MRVISGVHRSRVLEEVPSNDTRETKDRVKEAVFNSLQSYITDAMVLDLFAGSGSLGIEALSRGAAHVDFNDHSRQAINVIERNLDTLQLREKTTVSNKDAVVYIQEETTSYDIMLLDPPYKSDMLKQVMPYVAQKKLLSPHGIVVLLSGSETDCEKSDCGIEIVKKKRYGMTHVTYMKWSDNE